jgi:hypothetical protein
MKNVASYFTLCYTIIIRLRKGDKIMTTNNLFLNLRGIFTLAELTLFDNENQYTIVNTGGISSHVYDNQLNQIGYFDLAWSYLDVNDDKRHEAIRTLVESKDYLLKLKK